MAMTPCCKEDEYSSYLFLHVPSTKKLTVCYVYIENNFQKAVDTKVVESSLTIVLPLSTPLDVKMLFH